LGRVDARLPLALLRAVRQQDTPVELLPDEPASSFFPQRLGLSDVVEDQIRQFEEMARRRRPVDEARVAALLELIVRRVDAAAVLGAAGKGLGRRVVEGRSRLMRGLSRRLPVALRRRAVARTLDAALPGLLGGSDVRVSNSPLEVRARDALTARIGSYGGACQLFSSAIATAVSLYGVSGQVIHAGCQRHGDEACVWRLEAAAE